MSIENIGTPDAERAAKQATFIREHQAKAKLWGPVIPYGVPGPAGPGPTQSNDSPGADNGDGLKA